MLLLGPDGSVAEPVLGPDVAAGQHPQLVAPAGTWQGSPSAGAYTLVGTNRGAPVRMVRVPAR